MLPRFASGCWAVATPGHLGYTISHGRRRGADGSQQETPSARNPPTIVAFPAPLRTARERTLALWHLQALLGSMGVKVASECPSFARGRYLRVIASHPYLSALFWLEHCLDDLGEPAGPVVHWHGASRRLRLLPGAWGSVNAFHGKKATSAPWGLSALPGVLRCGFLAVVDGSAFVAPSEALEVAHG